MFERVDVDISNSRASAERGVAFLWTRSRISATWSSVSFLPCVRPRLVIGPASSRYVSPTINRRTLFLAIPNSRERSICRIPPRAYRDRISATWSLDSFLVTGRISGGRRERTKRKRRAKSRTATKRPKALSNQTSRKPFLNLELDALRNLSERSPANKTSPVILCLILCFTLVMSRPLFRCWCSGKKREVE